MSYESDELFQPDFNVPLVQQLIPGISDHDAYLLLLVLGKLCPEDLRDLDITDLMDEDMPLYLVMGDDYEEDDDEDEDEDLEDDDIDMIGLLSALQALASDEGDGSFFFYDDEEEDYDEDEDDEEYEDDEDDEDDEDEEEDGADQEPKNRDELLRENQQYMDMFHGHLKKAGMSDKRIKEHLDNIDLFLNSYLLEDPDDLYTAPEGIFLSDPFMVLFYIVRCPGVTPASIQSMTASLKRFYRCLLDNGQVSKEDYDSFLDEVKEDLPDWKTACARYRAGDIEGYKKLTGLYDDYT